MIEATTQCKNCGDEFANHMYVEGDAWKCPKPHVEFGYGFFAGGDPRQFHPDYESCSADEITNHKSACVLWDAAEARGETPTPEACPSGWVHDGAGNRIAHVLRAPYGIGGYSYEFDQYFVMPDGVAMVDIDDDDDVSL